MMTSTPFSKASAVFYVIWGLLHFQAAYSVYQLGLTLQPSMTQGRVFQNAWNLMFFSIAAIGVAVTMNWRNDRFGFWVNLCVVSVADVGFILFVLMPGLVGVWPGVLGPAFWLLGLACSALALKDQQPAPIAFARTRL
jgi:hypothetical protein